MLAMAPTTNIGSSTPIDSSGANLGSDLRRKVINDAAASLTALAVAHHRNPVWPQKAVRVASNLTAQQALKMNVIDMIAPTLPALLDRLQGYHTKDAQRPYTLNLAGAQIDTVKPGFFTRFLNALIDPNIISLLFLAGIAGIGFEIFHPGVVLPGALGAVALLVALFGFSVLPISWVGIVLILFGVALFVIDAHVLTHGALTVAGLIALSIGMIMLFHNAPAPYHTSTPLVLTITLAARRVLGARDREGGAGAPEPRPRRDETRRRRRGHRPDAGTGLRRRRALAREARRRRRARARRPRARRGDGRSRAHRQVGVVGFASWPSASSPSPSSSSSSCCS